jgi:hypothetical protein
MKIRALFFHTELPPQSGKGLPQSKGAARVYLRQPFTTAEGPGTAVILHSSGERTPMKIRALFFHTELLGLWIVDC